MLALAALLVGAGCRKQASQSPAPGAQTEEKSAAAPESEGPSVVRLTAAAMSEAGIATWQVKPVDVAHRLVLTGSVSFDENRTLQTWAPACAEAIRSSWSKASNWVAHGKTWCGPAPNSMSPIGRMHGRRR
jgi:hypothetical protein